MWLAAVPFSLSEKNNPCTTTSTTTLYTQKTSNFFSFSLSCLNPESPNLNLQTTQQKISLPKTPPASPKKKTLAPRFPLYEDVQDNSKSDNRNKYSVQKQGQIYTKCTERRDDSRSEEKRRSNQEGEAKQQRERRERKIFGKKSTLRKLV